ncbi:MAG: hypothetical protein PHX87_06060 [Candidatus Peribacteraceae bacterium]|nr:hypothetical protein [Candidatus Peribacteraceae bacterium]MDD5742954.1 hypothetical protein [Candidatus Peribacteraceae bacterium]
MRKLSLGSDELGAALKIRTRCRVIDVLSNGLSFPWFPEGFSIPLGVDCNDRPHHDCEVERTIAGVTLVFPVVFRDIGTYNSRGAVNVFRPYWIEWLAIHDWMLPPDQRQWRDGTMIEGVCALAQTPEIGSLRCHDSAWTQPAGQVYLRDATVVANCGGSSSFHHRMFVRRLHCPDPPRGLMLY